MTDPGETEKLIQVFAEWRRVGKYCAKAGSPLSDFSSPRRSSAYVGIGQFSDARQPGTATVSPKTALSRMHFDRRVLLDT
jgi:hypothetical protein